MNEYRFIVAVIAATDAEAQQVAAERLGHDEDYGFEYTLDWYDDTSWLPTPVEPEVVQPSSYHDGTEPYSRYETDEPPPVTYDFAGNEQGADEHDWRL